jgi:ABC-type nickel/cobalt efflux system permease component RcnA
MSGLFAILALGFVLGIRHAADPDHVIAVTTIVARHRTLRAAALIGAAWGLGHTLTILVVGAGIILFRWAIPERVGLSMELAVALMLIILGLASLRDVLRAGWRRVRYPRTEAEHSHAHSHGDYVHTHPHAHEPEAHPHQPDETPVSWLDRHFQDWRAYRLVRPLVIGVVHGLAGSAAVALLVVAAIGAPRLSVLYLLIFGLGTIVGMMLITAGLAVPFAYGVGASKLAAGRLRMASGVVSVAFGCFLAWPVGVVQGLLTGGPR